MPTTRERSGTTPSPRTRNPKRCPATSHSLGDGWRILPRIATPQRGGPAGVEMEAPVEPQIPPTTLPGPRGLGKAGTWPASLAEAEEAETGASGIPHIPQRHHICTDRCSHANLRRRRGLPPAEPQKVLMVSIQLASHLPPAQTRPRNPVPSTGPSPTRSSPHTLSGKFP